MKIFTEIMEKFIKFLEYLLINDDKPDNSCYLVIDCNLEELFKGIPLQLQKKILLLECPSEKVSYNRKVG